MTSVSLRNWLALAASALALVFTTAVVPFWFPPTEFVVGASYALGFNNGVSFLGYVVFLAMIVALIARLLPAPSRMVADGLHWKTSRFSGAIVAAVIGGHIALFAALYAYKGRFVFGEGLYFQSLLHRMLQGEVPYTDFGFYYGPLMLYPAYWLSRTVGLDAGYALWFVTTYVIGLGFLSVAVSLCTDTARSAAKWFVFLAVGLFNPLTGLNTTLMRYLFPSMVMILVVGFFRSGGVWRGIGAALVLAAAASYSFEVGALSVGAVLLGWAMFAAVSKEWHIARVAGLLATAAAFCLAVFLLIDPTGGALRDYGEIARSYSGGAHNVPIYPHLPFLALATVSAVGLGALVRVVASGPRDWRAAVAVLAAVVAIVSQRASFGAAEPLHYAYFGLPAFLIALYATTRYAATARLQTWLAAVLFVGIMLPMQYYHSTEFLPFLTARLQAAPAVPVSDNVRPASGKDLEAALRAAVVTLGPGRPYVMYEMEYYSLPVYREFGLRYPTYATMLHNARDHAGIARAIDEVRTQNAIVIVRKQDLRGPVRPRESGGALRVLDLVTGAHTSGSDLNAVLLGSRNELTRPFLEFLERDCVRVYESDGLVAFAPKQ
jgi:hypothetical protein